MYSAIHVQDGRLLFDPDAYLPRHDVLYRSPARKPYDGLALGGGRFGGLLWQTERSLEFSLNHTDAVDFGPDGVFKAWAWESEEENTAPFSLGRLSLCAAAPIFGWPYLTAFEQRLRLAQAAVEGCARTPFSQIKYRAFTPDGRDALVINVEARFEEATPLTLRLEKWATPNFFHHYEQIRRPGVCRGLNGTACEVEGGQIALSHQARGRAGCVVMTATGADCEASRLTAHGGELRFPAAKTHVFTVTVACGVADDRARACDAAQKALRAVLESDPFPAHCAAWRDFWSRSFIHIDDRDLENLYYLHLYHLNACARGQYPPLFGGLWTWLGDSRNWGHFYHWNHQQTLWGVYAAGHPELAENYLAYRRAMLENAQKDARTIYHADGAFFSDISNLNGYNALEPDTVRNFSVGAQIALDFIRHYRYTGDEAFWREEGLPVVCACLRFTADLLEKGDDGLYRARGGETAYESYLNLRESLSGIASCRALFEAALTLPGMIEEDRARYQEILFHLPPFPTEEIEHRGQRLTVFSAGVRFTGEPLAYGEGEYPRSPFPATLLTPVWPSRQIGLNQKGAQDFDIAQNTARVLLDEDVYSSGKLGLCGHAPAPEMAACLGMAEDARKTLRLFAQRYQVFPNGLWHFADIRAHQQWRETDRPRLLDAQRTQWEEVHEKDRGERASIASEWFLHSYFEASANLFCGIQQTLLQSTGGVIRVFPAEAGEAAFRLHAEGGFTVSAERGAEGTRIVVMESARGGACRLYNPWPGEPLCCDAPFTLNGDLVEISCAPGGRYVLYPASAPPDTYYVNDFAQASAAPSEPTGAARIGIKAHFVD